MLKLYPEQLKTQLNKELSSVYLLLGNDPLLLQESQDLIKQAAKNRGFDEYYTVQIDSNINWQEVFSFCCSMSLFSSRQILTLLLPENGINSETNEHLTRMSKFLHSDLLLILCINKLTKAQEVPTWFTRPAMKPILVNCKTPKSTQLPKWLAARAHQHGLYLDEGSCKLLCYYYEGNLSALVQALDQFSLLWPDGKLTVQRIEQTINDAAHFFPFHWVDALFSAKKKRALHILQKLRLEGNEPGILLRMLQRELLLLITLKRQSITTPLHELFDRYYIWKNRRAIIIDIISRFSHDQLRQAVHLLTQAELTMRKDYNQSVWSKLENLSMLFCQKSPLAIFINESYLFLE